jgi:hypothetical protein
MDFFVEKTISQISILLIGFLFAIQRFHYFGESRAAISTI